MNRYDYFDGAAIGAAFGSFSYGTGLIVRYPATAFTWSFYTSPLTERGGPEPALRDFLKVSGIQFNVKPNPIAPGSIEGVERSPQINKFNGARAVEAEVARIQSVYGSSIRGDVATSGKSLSMTNLNGSGRFPDIRFQTRSFWTGATNRFVEVKTGVQYLLGTKGGDAGVQAPPDAANLKAHNAENAIPRFLGQGPDRCSISARLAGNALRIVGPIFADLGSRSVGSIAFSG